MNRTGKERRYGGKVCVWMLLLPIYACATYVPLSAIVVVVVVVVVFFFS